MPNQDALLDRSNWSVRPWPSTFPVEPGACAALVVAPNHGEVHLLVNPHAKRLCTLEHLPKDVQRLVHEYVTQGPDQGWNPLAGGLGHATFLSAAAEDLLAEPQSTLTPEDLEVRLRDS